MGAVTSSVDQGVVADLLWAAEDADQGAVVDRLWAVEAVVAGRAEVLSEQEVAEPGPEVVARVLVEAGAPEVAAVVGALEVAEVEVLAEAVVAAVAVKPSQGPRTDCGPIEGGDAERLEKVIPLAGRDQYGSIPLYLNSPGGSVKAAFDMVKVGWTGKILAHLWPQEIVGNHVGRNQLARA